MAPCKKTRYKLSTAEVTWRLTVPLVTQESSLATADRPSQPDIGGHLSAWREIITIDHPSKDANPSHGPGLILSCPRASPAGHKPLDSGLLPKSGRRQDEMPQRLPASQAAVIFRAIHLSMCGPVDHSHTSQPSPHPEPRSLVHPGSYSRVAFPSREDARFVARLGSPLRRRSPRPTCPFGNPA